MRALVVSGGKTDSVFFRRYLLSGEYDLTVAVDSGMKMFYGEQADPDCIIGDFDSADPEILQYFRERHVDITTLIPEKDDTDTEAGLRLAIRRGADEITLIGATGSRLDHILGNIELLGIGLQEHVSICMEDPHNRIRMLDHGISLKKAEQYGDYFSLIPFTPKVTGLTITGAKYPLRDAEMVCFNSLGVSNEITAETAEISFDSGILLLLETRD